VKNKLSRRNEKREKSGQAKVHPHSTVRITTTADALPRGTDHDRAILALIGALKWQASKRMGAAARVGRDPDDKAKECQRLLGPLVTSVLADRDVKMPIGSFLKHKVVDVITTQDESDRWRSLIEGLVSVSRVSEGVGSRARRALEF